MTGYAIVGGVFLTTILVSYAIGNYRGRWGSFFKTRLCVVCERFRECPECKSQLPPWEV